MTNDDETVAIVFNGEIYNYRELRTALMTTGATFQTDSDTEVLLRLYERHGTSCVHHLRGMFAFGLWDERRHSLFLARDRLGKKPLFYRQTPESLEFASELSALTMGSPARRRPDMSALRMYLAYRDIPAPMSAFHGIRKLPPAHILTCNLDGQIHIERYWQLDYRSKLSLSDEEALSAIQDSLDEATRIRMVADVPVGVLLSGGVDSSLVVESMARQSAAPVRTFSIGFDEQPFSELPHARAVALAFDTEHHEFIVRADALEVLPTLIRHYGEPFADSSALPTFYVAKMARQHVKVVLNGDGGDESFGGYSHHRDSLTLQRIHGFHSSPSRAQVLGTMAALVPNLPLRSVQRIRRALELTALSPDEAYARLLYDVRRPLADCLVTEAFGESAGQPYPMDASLLAFRNGLADHPLDRILAADVDNYLPNDLLVKMDVATMAHSLEARSPFLDHVFMELAARLPPDLKVRGLRSKYALKRLARRRLPRSVVDRPKQGFSAPISMWMRGKLAGYVQEVLLDEQTLSRGLTNPNGVRRLISAHTSGRADHGRDLWTLLCLELWFREVVDRP
jgi:asparagine synthase (glutamine-hydrolysing)